MIELTKRTEHMEFVKMWVYQKNKMRKQKREVAARKKHEEDKVSERAHESRIYKENNF